jgi:hypothetical protein
LKILTVTVVESPAALPAVPLTVGVVSVVVELFAGAVSVTDGATASSNVIESSVLVDAKFVLPAASCAAPAGIETVTVPSELTPETWISYVVPDPLTDTVPPVAVPPRTTSDALKPVTDSVNWTVNRSGCAVVGSV